MLSNISLDFIYLGRINALLLQPLQAHGVTGIAMTVDALQEQACTECFLKKCSL